MEFALANSLPPSPQVMMVPYVTESEVVVMGADGSRVYFGFDKVAWYPTQCTDRRLESVFKYRIRITGQPLEKCFEDT